MKKIMCQADRIKRRERQEITRHILWILLGYAVLMTALVVLNK